MSTVSSNSNSNSNRDNMNNPASFHEIKKQASFFLREKIKTARLALTDVTPAQLLAEEATNANSVGPDARTLKMLSKAAFEVDDYWRIVGILHKRLVKYDKRNWRESYKAVVVLEYLLTHGPESVAEEFQRDRDEIREMERFQYIDEKGWGFNWGLNVRKKCDRTLKLLEKGPLLKEERDKARKISREIQGFGSFRTINSNTSSSEEKPFQRCNSQFNDHTNHDDFLRETPLPLTNQKQENERDSIVRWNSRGESESLLLDDEKKDEMRNVVNEDHHHPFDEGEHLTAALSLL